MAHVQPIMKAQVGFLHTGDTTMAAITDLIVRSADNKPQLLVEVKTRRGADAQWAASLRRNLFEHTNLPSAPYFLLALPDRFYLWKGASRTEIQPNYEIDANEVLGPYLKDLPFSLSDLTGQSLELLVRNWLEDVVSDNQVNWSETRATAQLRLSGLYDAIKDGLIDAQVVA